MIRCQFLQSLPLAPMAFAQAEAGIRSLFVGRTLAGRRVHEGHPSAFYADQGDLVVHKSSNYPTGSLYHHKRSKYPAIEVEKWYLMQLRVEGLNCVVRISGKTVLEFDQLENTELQAHARGKWTESKRIRIKRFWEGPCHRR